MNEMILLRHRKNETYKKYTANLHIFGILKFIDLNFIQQSWELQNKVNWDKNSQQQQQQQHRQSRLIKLSAKCAIQIGQNWRKWGQEDLRTNEEEEEAKEAKRRRRTKKKRTKENSRAHKSTEKRIKFKWIAKQQNQLHTFNCYNSSQLPYKRMRFACEISFRQTPDMPFAHMSTNRPATIQIFGVFDECGHVLLSRAIAKKTLLNAVDAYRKWKLHSWP